MNHFRIRNFFLVFLFVIGEMAGTSVFAQHVQENLNSSKQESSAGNLSALIDAKKLLISGNIKDAEALLRNYTEKYPGDPVGFFELAKILAGQKSYDEAKLLAEKAYELDRSNIWYQLFLAETCQLSQDYDQAVTIYETIVASNPDNLDYYYQLAALYLGLGNYQQAIEIYNKIEKRIGITEDISMQKHKIYLHLKEYPDAEAELMKLMESHPDDSRYYSILAEYNMSRDKKEKALELYNKILEIDPDNAYIHMTLADYYRKTGEKEKVFNELKLGFGNPNLDVDTKVQILLSFYTVNEIVTNLKKEAFELADILIQTHPDDPKVYSIHGDLLAQDQQFEKARNAFLRVIDLDSSKYVVWEELLRMDLLMSDYLHLSLYGHRAVELFPEQPYLYLFTGLGEFQLKQYTEAEKILNRGVHLVVNNNDLLAQFYMYLGDTYHALNRTEESDKAYEKSLQIKENNPYVLNNYSYYLALRGIELEKAETMSQKALTLEPDNSSFQDTYGWVLFKLGRYEKALEWIGKSMDDRENLSGEVLEHYGDVLFKLGRKEEARDYWKQALEKGGGSDLLQDKVTGKKGVE
ncbi:MAG: tetratricopeptide repeat protein [Bacteroidales bacterium]|nr:tetratricopeptide repeat protein [Bacteroidales bacterium]